MSWRVYAASAIGKQHTDSGKPCQDAFAFDRAGDWLIAVVSDGAGSAERSQAGSVLCATGVVSRLAERIRAPDFTGDLGIADFADAIADVRETIEREAEKHDCAVNDFSATLVGVAISSAGGSFFHIGDGIAAAKYLDNDTITSLPENGEFANETWFITADTWRDHLRTTPIPPDVECLALMSDGAMPFVMNREQSDLFNPFYGPVSRFLLGVDEVSGSEALFATLDDPRTWSITGDDKTLLLAFHDGVGQSQPELTV
jgi:hypothetical protein